MQHTAWKSAIRETGGDPAAVAREAELYGTFMNPWLPGWFEGFGRGIRTWLKVCAAFTLLAFFGTVSRH